MIVTYPSGPGGKANAPDAIAAFIAAFRAITLARSSGLRPSGSSVSGILERKRSRTSLSRPSGGSASSGGTRLFVMYRPPTTTWGPDLSGLTHRSYQDRNDIGIGK